MNFLGVGSNVRSGYQTDAVATQFYFNLYCFKIKIFTLLSIQLN